jgi:hypothetical protein
MQLVVTIQKSSKLAERLVAMLAVAVIPVCVMFLLFAFQDATGFPVKRLVSMVALTLGVFPPVVADFRPSWRQWRFWVAVSALFALHLFAGVVAWRAEVESRAITYGAIGFVEIALLWGALEFCGFSQTRRAP